MGVSGSGLRVFQIASVIWDQKRRFCVGRTRLFE
jgi:hypothetical protein